MLREFEDAVARLNENILSFFRVQQRVARQRNLSHKNPAIVNCKNKSMSSTAVASHSRRHNQTTENIMIVFELSAQNPR